MKKILFALLLSNLAFGKVINIPVTLENIKNFDQIIDIRTPDEWRATGIVKNAKMVQLINDKEKFLEQIKAQIDIAKPFAIICQSGRRSSIAANIIDDESLEIINLQGGMGSLILQGYETEPVK